MPTHKKRGVCNQPRCTRLAAPKKGGKCHTCASRKWRRDNPVKHAFNNLRCHARERGKPFTLTFERFAELAVRLDYIDRKGHAADAFHIDRRDETKGYTDENIRVCTNRENTKKYQEWKRSFVRDVHGHKWQSAKQAGLP